MRLAATLLCLSYALSACQRPRAAPGPGRRTGDGAGRAASAAASATAESPPPGSVTARLAAAIRAEKVIYWRIGNDCQAWRLHHSKRRSGRYRTSGTLVRKWQDRGISWKEEYPLSVTDNAVGLGSGDSVAGDDRGGISEDSLWFNRVSSSGGTLLLEMVEGDAVVHVQRWYWSAAACKRGHRDGR